MSEAQKPPEQPVALQFLLVSSARDPSTESSEASALEPRMLAAWREWLGALASDADAALAAADLYAGLAPEARDAWLDALAEDAPVLSVPSLALYAPLLGVETDPDRRARMEVAITLGTKDGCAETRTVRALSGMTSAGQRVVALTQPVYLQFVRVLWCSYLPDKGIFWAKHDSLLAASHAPKAGDVVDGVTLEPTPLPPIVEDLAHAILAHQRQGSDLPASLREFADLFDTDVEAIDGTV